MDFCLLFSGVFSLRGMIEFLEGLREPEKRCGILLGLTPVHGLWMVTKQFYNYQLGVTLLDLGVTHLDWSPFSFGTPF